MGKSFFHRRAFTYILLLCAAHAFGGAITSTWIDGNGNWSVAGNWDNGVPNNGGGNTFTAVLNDGSSVLLNTSVTINNLTIGLADSLTVNNGQTLAINSGTGAGLVTDNGTISLNSTGSLTDFQLAGGGTVTLGGSGTLTLSNSANNRIYGVSSTALVIGTGELVEGAGQIGVGQTTITNNGTITANQSAGLTLAPSAGGFANNGTIQTSGSGLLILSGGTFTNTSGTILLGSGTTGTVNGNAIVNGGPVTLSANSTLNLSNGTVHGGTLTNSSTGNIVATASTTDTLGGVVNNVAGGQISVANNALLQLEGTGTFTNDGSINLNSTGSLTDLAFIGGGTVTLGGSGTIMMSNNASNRLYGVSSTALVIGANQLVQGAGQIGISLTKITNNGTITANQSAGLTLAPSAGGFANNGTIQTSGSGLLVLSGGTFTNTNGNILLSAGTTGTLNGNAIVNGGPVTLSANSTLNLSNGTIHGGTLTNTSTGNIIATAGTTDTLGGIVNNVAGGQISVANNALLQLEGTGTFTNNSSINLNSTGSLTDLSFIGGGTVTLGGSGTVILSNSANNRIYGASSTALVIGANQLVEGAGQLGVSLTKITNNGTITANQSAGLTLAPSSGGFTNNSTIQSVGAPLTFSGGTFTNTSGTILLGAGTTGTLNGGAIINGGPVTLSANAILNLTNGTIHGGTLTNTSTGNIVATAGSTDTLGGTVNNVAGGQISEGNSALLQLEGTGTYTNNSTINLNSTGSLTDLSLIGGGTVTLGGAGTIALSNSANNRIYGASSTALVIGPNQLVEGAGQIGVSLTAITNNGTITANQSAGLTLAPSSGGFTNNGTIQSTSGPLTFTGGTFTNTSGTILLGANTTGTLNGGAIVNGGPVTLSANSILNLSNGTIHGGTLTNSSTGNIIALAGTNNALGGIVNNVAGGQITLNNTAVLGFEGSGTFTNNGNIALNSTGGFTDLELVGGGTVTLGGTGTVTLSNSTFNRILGISSTALVIGPNQLVQGAGQIGVSQTTITNNGTIAASQSAGIVIHPSATGFTNNGTVQSSAAADTLQISGTFTNWNGATQTITGGTLNALGGGTIKFDGANIINNAANIFLSGAGSDIVNGLNSADGIAPATFAHNLAAGVFTIGQGRNYSVLSGFTNAGITNVGPGSTLTLAASYVDSGGLNLQGDNTGSATLNVGTSTSTVNGGGTISLSNSPNNLITGASGNIFVNADNLIQGAGNIGNNLLFLQNNSSGTISGTAGGASALVIDPIGTSASATPGMTNTGTLQANAGNLILQDGNFSNAGGSIKSINDGNLLIDPSKITGGTISVSSGSEMDLSSATIAGAAVTNSGIVKSLAGTNNSIGDASSSLTNNASGNIHVMAGSTLTLVNASGATFTNNGTITLDNGANTTLQVSGGNLNLIGLGTVQLSSDGTSRISGAAPLTDALTNGNAISGSGLISQLGLTNAAAGAINANTNGQTLQVTSSTGSWTNLGLLEASGGGTLALAGSPTLTNGGGTIQANAGGKVDLSSMTVNGGTLKTVGTGTLQLDATNVNSFTAFTNSATGTVLSNTGANTIAGLLDNSAGGNVTVASGTSLALNQLNNGGLTQVSDNSTLTLNSGVTDVNSGTISLNSLGSAAKLVINNGNVTLSGAGNITLAVQPATASINSISGSGTTPTLTNSGNTIQGVGTISGLGLANGGIIQANVSGATLTVQPNVPWTNAGTLQASNGGTLILNGTSGGTLTNTGTAAANAASTVDLQSFTATGGNFKTVGTGLIQFDNSVVNAPTSFVNSSTGTVRIFSGAANSIGGLLDNSAGGNVTVGGGTSLTVNQLNNGGVMQVSDNSTLTLDGGVTDTNSGTISLNSVGSAAKLIVSNGTVTLNGGGNIALAVQLPNSAINSISGSGVSPVLTNINNTMQGVGTISAIGLTNGGVVQANLNGGTLNVQPNVPWTNTGTLQASNGGTLNLSSSSGGTLTNTGGTTAANAGSTVDLQSFTATGGAFKTVGTGLIQFDNSVVNSPAAFVNSATGTVRISSGAANSIGGLLDNSAGGSVTLVAGVTLNLNQFSNGGSMTLADGANLNLAGGFADTNVGSIALNSAGSPTKLAVSNGTATFIGGGSVALSNNVNNAITGSGAAPGLVNGNTIGGAGTISGLALSNNGTIQANVSNPLTITPTGTAANTGILQATSASSLFLNGNYNSTGGTILAAGAGSQVQLNNGTSITGGTLSTSGGGVILGAGNVNLAALTNTGSYQVTSGSLTVLQNSITNTGTFTVPFGGSLNISGAVSLVGGGAVRLSGTIQDQAGSNSTLTTDNLFTGTGNIGNGHMTLVSNGTIQPDAGGMLMINTPGGFTSNGTVSVKGGSTLNLPGPVTNNGMFSNSGNLLASVIANTATGTFSQTGSATFAGDFSNSGSATLGGTQNWAAGTHFNNTAGAASFTSDAGAAGANLAVNASGGQITASSAQHLASLTIGAGATVTLAHSGANALSTSSLSIAGFPGNWTGKLDIANNPVLLSYSGASPVATVADQIKSGFNHGNWLGDGITSADAAADPAQIGLGFADGADHVAAGLTPGQILVKDTRMGDANLDGVVNVVDLGILATHYGRSGTWDQGDYNYDGVINVVDLGILATNYGKGTSLTASQANAQFRADLAEFPQLQSAVPEPASLAFLVAGGAMLLMRRRSNRAFHEDRYKHQAKNQWPQVARQLGYDCPLDHPSIASL